MEQLMCLFKAFKTLHDQIFKNFIQSVKDKWKDRENIEWTNLIYQAGEKYKSLCEAGTWKNKHSSKQAIIALAYHNDQKGSEVQLCHEDSSS